MKRIEGQPILTAAQMRAAEERAAPTPEAMYGLMERAGAGVAEAVQRLAGGAETLILCGPGNNGGDGYVAARVLAKRGHPVRVAVLGEPTTDLARRARAGWTGPVTALADAAPAPVVVDALFGTGLSRPLDDLPASLLRRLADQAWVSIAVDLPSGVATDSGSFLSAPPPFDLTLALGALKPAHMLMPAAGACGAVRLVDIGIVAEDAVAVLGPPTLTPPGPGSHKYSRGMVAVIGGAMPGAGSLAAEAALRAGAGYALLLADERPAGLPHAIVIRPLSAAALADQRIGAVVVGPGLGRDAAAWERVTAALASGHPIVLDGDALWLIGERGGAGPRAAPVVATPHAGEFARAYGDAGDKLAATLAAAARTGTIIVHKGPDTVIAAPDGRARMTSAGTAWLSTAGTGDVLAGAIGAMLAGGSPPLDAAAAGVWLHAEAARRCGASFIADDLAHALTAARASL